MTTQSFRCKTHAHIHTTVSEVIKKVFIQGFRTISENQCLLQILKVTMIGRRDIIKAFKDSNRYEHVRLKISVWQSLSERRSQSNSKKDPTVRDPKDPWSLKEEILLEDAIMANISRAEKKKKCQVVCHTHGVGSSHHARSDSVLVSVPTIAPQGLAILLADAATQTEISEDEESPRLLRSKSLPLMYNLDWP
ncbi:hypothetical protein Tco_0980042 [Tanacetum coccineum]